MPAPALFGQNQSFRTHFWPHIKNYIWPKQPYALALGIAGSDYNATCVNIENREGKAQIDLLFDIRGGAIYLFEMKFCEHPQYMWYR